MVSLLDSLAKHAALALKAKYALDDDALARIAIDRSQKDDLQTAAAMQLTKIAKVPPRELAEVVAAALAAHEAVDATSIAGPGFVNIRLKDAWLAAHVADGLALRAIGAGQRIVIDYSSPNVAKPMHIAHIRSTIIGEALKRSLRAVGYEVIADNHLGDWGTQFGKLIVAYRRWLDPVAFEKNAVDELLRLYIKFQEEEKAEGGAAAEEDTGEEKVTPLLAAARAELVKLQQGDAENRALWQKFIDVSMKEFNHIYQRLGVSFDVVHGESFYNDRLAATVQLLREKGIAEESRGALVVFFRKPDGTDEMTPAIIQKADGGYNYTTTDVAGTLFRVEKWNPSRILIVVDERQQLHFKQFFTIARQLGVTASLEHVGFGLMRLPEGTISTREGKLISLEALLDEAEKRALAVAKESSPELSDAEHQEIARVVGIGAVKYNDLSKDRQSGITFTWDKALALNGNTAPYLQYAYARIQSILRKARDEGAGSIGPVAALTPAERTLVLALLGFPGVVEQVAKTARPHHLADYLYSLSGTFSSFYADHPVLKADPALRASRLQLCAAVAETLKRGLELLGIEVLDRM